MASEERNQVLYIHWVNVYCHLHSILIGSVRHCLAVAWGED